MPVTPPTLTALQNSDPGSTAVQTINANRTAQDDFNSSVAAEFAGIQQGQAVFAAEDLRRRRTSSSPIGGRIGDSLRFNVISAGSFSLLANTVDNQSHAYIADIRYTAAGDLAGDFATESLADGSYTYFVGVGAVGSTTQLQVEFDQVEANVSLPLYTVDITVSSSIVTIDAVRPIAETKLFDNTVFQGMMAAGSTVVSQSFEAVAANDNYRFTVQHQCRIVAFEFHQVDDLAGATVELQSSSGADTYASLAMVGAFPADHFLSGVPVAAFTDIVFPSGHQFQIVFTSVTTPGVARITVHFAPAFDDPEVIV